jgi:hypothetical protein
LINKVKKKEKRVVSVNFSCAVFSLLDFSTLEDGTEMLSQNVSYASLHGIREEHRSLMTVWRCRLLFGSTLFGSE